MASESASEAEKGRIRFEMIADWGIFHKLLFHFSSGWIFDYLVDGYSGVGWYGIVSLWWITLHTPFQWRCVEPETSKVDTGSDGRTPSSFCWLDSLLHMMFDGLSFIRYQTWPLFFRLPSASTYGFRDFFQGCFAPKMWHVFIFLGSVKCWKRSLIPKTRSVEPNIEMRLSSLWLSILCRAFASVSVALPWNDIREAQYCTKFRSNLRWFGLKWSFLVLCWDDDDDLYWIDHF